MHCETGGTDNWHIVSHTGKFRGGLQADSNFWSTYAGLEFAPSADLATPEEQIIVATRARDGYGPHNARGYSPWPTCRKEV